MSWSEENNIHAIFKYTSKVYGKKYFTQEVVVRAMKNLTLEERQAFFAELVELKACGMHNALIGKKSRIRMLVFGKLVISFCRGGVKGNELVISSIVPAPKTTVITKENARNFVML